MGKFSNSYFVFSHHNSSEPEEKIKREKNFIALLALINVSWMTSSRELSWTVSSLPNLFYSSPLTLLELGCGYVNTDGIFYCLIVQKKALYVSRSQKLFFVKLSTGNRIEKNIHPFKLRNGITHASSTVWLKLDLFAHVPLSNFTIYQVIIRWCENTVTAGDYLTNSVRLLNTKLKVTDDLQ